MGKTNSIELWIANSLSPAAGKSESQQVFDLCITAVIAASFLSTCGYALWWTLRGYYRERAQKLK